MKIIIGSKNQDKLEIVGRALSEIGLDAEIFGVDVDSGITNQPLGKETTKIGAINRARNAKKMSPGGDLWIGLEGGLHDYGKGYVLVTFVCLIDKKKREFFGEGDEIPLPDEVSQKVKKGGWFGELIREYGKKHKINQNLITRSLPFKQAVQYAYVESVRETLDYRDKVSGVIVNNEGKILIVRLGGFGKNKWSFPGGGIEKGETQKQALMRELSEEIQSNKFEIGTKSRYVFHYEWSPFLIIRYFKIKKKMLRGQEVKYFLVRYFGKDNGLTSDGKAVKEIKWVNKADISKYIVFDGQLEIAEKVVNEFFGS